MTTAPILPFRLRKRNAQYEWTGATQSTVDEDHGLIRLEEKRIVIETTRSRRIRKTSALGSIETTYENFPVEEHAISLDDIVGVSFRVPTWNFWSAPRVVFHVREMRLLEGLPAADAAEFSVPVLYRDRAIANAFVVQCHLALSTVKPPLPDGASPALGA
ncbi:MAG: hypothetical protein ACHQ50_00140 [Fimbriimonadales bacterium]